MNYTIALLTLLAIAVTSPVRGEEETVPDFVVFTDQVFEIPLEAISVLLVEYSPSSLSTNLVDEGVTTIASSWTLLVQVELNDWVYSLNGHGFVVDRFRGSAQLSLSDAEVEPYFSEVFDSLQYAASSGEFEPTGATHAAFLALAASRLAERIETD